MKRNVSMMVAGVLIAALVCGAAQATIAYDQDVTPDVIFGSGNTNGAFTTDRRNGIELGLRGKLRFDETGQPQNTFNSNGDGTYTFDPGVAVGGWSSNTPVWNFEWSINVDYLGVTGKNLIDFEYYLEIDNDPTAATDFFGFDPMFILPPDYFDHAIGDNTTPNGGGTVATSNTEYVNLLIANNVAQNSWNYDFFDSGTWPFDPTVGGARYDIRLSVFSVGSSGTELAQTQIAILTNAVPEPLSMLFFGTGLVGVTGFAVRRRRNRA